MASGARPRDDGGWDDADTRRLTILEAAARAFVERGFHDTSMQELATTLGVTKPVLYYYVPNKDRLLFECGRLARQEVEDALAAARARDGDALAALRTFFIDYAGTITRPFGRCLALVDASALQPETRRADTAARRSIERAVEAMVRDAKREGSLGDVDTALVTRALFGMFNALARWFQPSGQQSASDVGAAYFDMLVEGIRSSDRMSS